MVTSWVPQETKTTTHHYYRIDTHGSISDDYLASCFTVLIAISVIGFADALLM